MGGKPSFTLRQKLFYEQATPAYLDHQENLHYARYLVGKLLSSLTDRGKRLLEVGAGQGRFTFELVKHVSDLFALDISGHEINLLKRRAKRQRLTNLKAEVHDLLTIDKTLSGQPFDNIVGFFILHHLPKVSYPRVVNNLSRFLKRGGRISFIEPNNLYPFHLIEILIEKEMKWEIEKGIYSNYLGCFKAVSKKANLRLVHFSKFGFMPPPIINKLPVLTKIDKVIEKIPLIREFFCPFVLITVEKS